MRPVLPVRGRRVQPVSHNQHRTAGDVVRKHTQLIPHVENPDDIRIRFPHFHRRIPLTRHVRPLLLEGTIIANAHPVHIQTDHLTPVCDQIDPLPINRRRGTDAQILPVTHLARTRSSVPPACHRNSPSPRPDTSVSPVTDMSFISRRFIIRPHKDTSVGYCGISIRLRPRAGCPSHASWWTGRSPHYPLPFLHFKLHRDILRR